MFKKVISLCVATLAVLTLNIHSTIISVQGEEVVEEFIAPTSLPEDHVFTTTDEHGNVIELDMDSIDARMEEVMDVSNQSILLNGSSNLMKSYSRSIAYGVVNFKTKDATQNTNYVEDITGRAGYTNGSYGADAAFLGYSSDGSKVKFMQAGVTGWVNTSEVQILNYEVMANNPQEYSITHYIVQNGRILHKGTLMPYDPYYQMVTDVGPKQSYMNENVKYYSFDGHYFYTSYQTMINDYKSNSRSNSINPNAPYYNYYQYLSHRSQTNIPASVLDAKVLSVKPASSTIMDGLGSSFISNQNLYGSNALLMFSVAANESAWGTSTIALARNNLFGHAAYDHDPMGGANGYSSPSYSIYYHAKVFVSEGYLDPKDYGGRYYGGHLGDKASGLNVKYASDPYWGEKAANVAWSIDRVHPQYADSSKYTLGVKQSTSTYNIRQEATTASNVVFQTGSTSHFPFIILDDVNGQGVSGNSLWYKVQSDATLNSTRSAIVQDKGDYNFNNFYLYVHSSSIKIVHGDVVSEPEPNPEPEPTYVLGDVNGDKLIGSIDYLMIKDSINGKITLSTSQRTAADVNKDGLVGSIDYLMVKDHILGKIVIK